MLGTALKQKGDMAEAAKALERPSGLDPENPGPYNTLGQLLRITGDGEGSKAAFEAGAKAKARKEAEQADLLKKK